MRTYVINLDRSPERLAEFMALNGHVANLSRFPAVDGRTLDRADLVRRGIIAADLDYTDGAVGSLLSHLSLWEKAERDGQPLTVVEDDSILNLHWERDSAAILDTVDADWDIIFWGWNFDAFAVFELLPGVSPFVAQFDQDRMRMGVENFRAAAINPRALRLYAAFGILCYSISPVGARRLRAVCTPMQNRPVTIPMVNRAFANKDLGIAILEFLPHVKAFASFPPLAISRNEHATSTLLTQQQPQT